MAHVHHTAVGGLAGWCSFCHWMVRGKPGVAGFRGKAPLSREAEGHLEVMHEYSGFLRKGFNPEVRNGGISDVRNGPNAMVSAAFWQGEARSTGVQRSGRSVTVFEVATGR